MNIWRVLGIEATKDKELIKQAYREHLMRVNPEDDPEGFQILRKAYEEALIEADRKEDGSKWDDTPVGHFMEKVEELFLDFPRRVDPKNWEKLLEDDLVLGLDTKQTICEEMLGFFMSHHLLPHNVWAFLVETFSLEERKEELAEKFPKDFLDYLLNNARYEDSIDFCAFEEKEKGLPYDDYISLYHNINGLLQRRDTEKAEPLIQQLRDLGLTHPQGKVLYVRFLLQKDEDAIADLEAEEILEEYEDKIYVKMMMAEINWKKENYEECLDWYEQILSELPDHYGAKCGLAECKMKSGDFAGAKKIFRDLLNINRFDDYVHKCMLDCNEELTIMYTNKVAENPKDYESSVELIWCHYQNYEFDKAKEVIDNMPIPDNYYIMDYYYLYGRVTLQMENKEEALEAFMKWNEVYELHKNDEGDPEVLKRNHDRVGLTNFFIAEVYSDMADAEKDMLLYEKALEYNELAMEKCTIDRGMFLTQHAHLCLKLGRFEEVIEYGEKAVFEEQNNFEAYMAMGEAFTKMELYREALDEYQNATTYCPYYVKPYIDQIKIYLQFDAYDQAQEVVDRFLGTQVPSLWIKVYQAKILRGKGQLEEAKQMIAEVEDGMKDPEAPQDIQEQDTVYHEKALIYYYLDDLDQSVESLKKALELEPESARYHYFMGNLLWDQNKYEDSISAFLRARQIDPDNANICVQLGSVCMDAKKKEQGFEAFMEAVRLDPKHPQVYGKLGQFYEDQNDVNKAIEYYSMQLDNDPSSYYYISRGLMYFVHGDFDLSEQDYLSAADMDNNNGYAYYNRGRIFLARGNNEEAKLLLQKAIEVSGDQPPYIFLKYLSVCYSRMGQIKEAIKTLEGAIDKNIGNPYSIKHLMASMCATHGISEMAIKYYEEAKTPQSECANLASMTELSIIQGIKSIEELDQELNRFYSTHPHNDQVRKALMLLNLVKNNKIRAKRLFALMNEKNLSNSDLYHGALLNLGDNETQVAHYLDRLEQEMTDELPDYQGRKHCFFRLGMIEVMRGNFEKARDYLQQMEAAPICDFCLETGCYEVFFLKGKLAEAAGNCEFAQSQYEKAFKITKNDIDVFMSLGGKE